VKVVDVVNGSSDALRELHRPMRSLVEQERKDRLDAICQPLHDRDIEFTTELIRGRPFVEIVREVVHEGFHLVIKTAQAEQATETMGILGPIDLRLVRNCPCPVWLESPLEELTSQRILVAIDPQAEAESLNNVLLEMGASLAKAVDAELHVVSAWAIPNEEFLAEKMADDELAGYFEEVRLAAQKELEATLVHAGKPARSNNVHLRKGNAAKTILDFVSTCSPDLVVIGTVSHTNVRGLLIGNTADTVLRQIGCSVLAVKPDSLFRV
jgi:nucleotide-binding universal stress UspA family protein